MLSITGNRNCYIHPGRTRRPNYSQQRRRSNLPGQRVGQHRLLVGFHRANFTAAQTGTSAFVLTGTPSWISSLPAAPAAKWLGTDGTSGTGSGDTAMYAVSFNIPDAFVSGSLTLNYAVDNELGGSNAGITSMGTRSHRPLGLGLSPVSLLTWTLNVARTSFTEPIGFI